ncbi:hypothetical protein [Ruegeria sp. SCP11]|uniref:hypothetical protein n=1 Tax=Ruegeria sp. SCP11 TaxID=3141378 RepID=UPI00333AA6D1
MTPPEIELRKIEIPTDIGIKLPNGYRLSARIGRPENAAEDPIPAILELPSYRGRDSEELIENRYACPHTSARQPLNHVMTRELYNPLRVEPGMVSSETRPLFEDDCGLTTKNNHDSSHSGTAFESWAISPTDPLSARFYCIRTQEISRNDIALRTDENCEIWQDKATCIPMAKMNAFEDKSLISSSELEESAPRDQMWFLGTRRRDICPCPSDRIPPNLTHASIKSPPRADNTLNWEIFE